MQPRPRISSLEQVATDLQDAIAELEDCRLYGLADQISELHLHVVSQIEALRAAQANGAARRFALAEDAGVAFEAACVGALIAIALVVLQSVAVDVLAEFLAAPL